ncbi:response regulator transcription factor [Propionimicrobium sp. PCR01-08-3]|uniref:winged helix-turn-helix domain-containing protein n=1 Tax=Propionimicrobium sp. PCR01-08-3 TaxID=3052086 RepID=UPI00255C31FA|nr:response regulator transcription factor [Propionimicrobium sp. PCR01-08-3]WIY82005.1 response regulator transcription factor [Propionimicrobium sp. PCR01-08-3]
MAEIVFVTPAAGQANAAPPPSALGLLSHTVHPVLGGDQAIRIPAGSAIAMVDARADLAAARATCQLLVNATSGWPILLLVPASGLSVISADWRVQDFILEDAGPAEFDARIKLLMATTSSGNVLSAGPVTIDEDAYVATVGGVQLDLTYTEFELLKYLVAHPGRVLTREQLLSEVWGYDYFGGTRTVDVHIRRLRAKLGPEYDACIGTVRNVGYRFAVDRQS